MRFQSVSPKILTVVDIADNGQAIRYRQFDGIHGRFHRITADGTSNTWAMEYSRISQDLIPFHHIPFQWIKRRILAVINHAGITHRHGFLKIISTQTFSATYHMRNIQTILSEMHQRSFSHFTIRHTGDIFYVVSQISQRDSDIRLTASIIAFHATALE